MSAFPSVGHAWILHMLHYIKHPHGLFCLAQKLYQLNNAYLGTSKGYEFMFVVVCGVLQGCPLSGSLFVISFGPLPVYLKKHIEDVTQNGP